MARSATLLKRFDGRRLKVLLSVFFLALAAPTGILIWQAYSQLKWEAFYQHRGMAEELTRQIDARLREHILEADRRSFADYAFLGIAGRTSANILQRSPLAAFPVESGPPGVIGYFQVDAQGDFSTPLLPPAGTEPAAVGIEADEFALRSRLAARVRDVLSDNSLVRHRPVREFSFAEPPAEVAEGGSAQGARESAQDSTQASVQSYSQRGFDDLDKIAAQPGSMDRGEQLVGARAVALRREQDDAGNVAGLGLKSVYRDKVSELEESAAQAVSAPQARARRTEQVALPESDSLGAIAPAVPDADDGALRIDTFESEVDPHEFSMLDSGHFVLFRKVWRDGQRFIQGMLIDRDVFLESAIGKRFEAAALAGMADLIVAYHDEVLSGPGMHERRNGTGLEGTLLYQNRLSAPLDSLALVFSIRNLPAGPGAAVLAWVTVLLAGVFLGGFYALYSLAMGQLRLARKQQDFVSAVSHELKTPLTSIRMYAEMLKEGWADKQKRQQYYEYIHDESERLTRLISNVLRLASITRNEPRLAMRPITVRELMELTEARISSQIERAGFEALFEREQQSDSATLMIDEDCFLQIVINLVDNAIKFSSSATVRRIEIGSRLSRNGQVAFSVRDFGPGVPAGQMKKIFELFYRSESELTRETVGTGIGLAIVHQLSLAMKGSVDVVNRNPGAEFRLYFPQNSQ